MLFVPLTVPASHRLSKYYLMLFVCWCVLCAVLLEYVSMYVCMHRRNARTLVRTILNSIKQINKKLTRIDISHQYAHRYQLFWICANFTVDAGPLSLSPHCIRGPPRSGVMFASLEIFCCAQLFYTLLSSPRLWRGVRSVARRYAKKTCIDCSSGSGRWMPPTRQHG